MLKKYNKVTNLGFASVIAISAATTANAEEYFEGTPLDLSFNAAWVSDYRFRGISQSDEKPALQLGGDAVYSLENIDLYAGLWGSQVDFNDGDEARVEVDYYGGVAFEAADLAFDVGFIYYTYPGADSSLEYDFIEYTGSVGYEYEGLFLAYSLNYSPDYFAGSGDAYYNKVSLEYSFYPALTFSGYVGKQTVEDNAAFLLDDYTDWGIGATYEIEDLFDVSLNYITTNLSDTKCGSDNCDSTLVLSVSKSF